MIREIQFEAEYIKTHIESTLVIGRCCGDTILLGDHFSAIYDQDLSVKPVALLNGRTVHLEVASINPIGDSLGCCWDFIDPSCLARIELTGHGREKLHPFCVLVNDKQGP